MSNLSLRHTAHEGFDQNIEAAGIKEDKDASADGVKNEINNLSEIAN